MIIMVSTLAAAINECRYITPEELARDNIKSIKDPGQNKPEENRKEGENNV